MVGREDIQLGFVLVKGFSIEIGNLLGCLALSQRCQDDLVAAPFQLFLAHVAYVGYVFYVDYLDALVHQGSPDPVGHQIGA